MDTHVWAWRHEYVEAWSVGIEDMEAWNMEAWRLVGVLVCWCVHVWVWRHRGVQACRREYPRVRYGCKGIR